MYQKISVNLGNLVLSLSDVLDLAFPSLLLENTEVIRKAVEERQEQARHYYQTEVER
jgi:hypothetical protein